MEDIKNNPTGRGFDFGEFDDLYDNGCSIQKSSLATDNAIWFGINDPDPKIMASQASQFGVETDQRNGWVKYPIPKEVCMNTRMHLNQEQVAKLLPILQRFVETGDIFEE